MDAKMKGIVRVVPYDRQWQAEKHRNDYDNLDSMEAVYNKLEGK